MNKNLAFYTKWTGVAISLVGAVLASLNVYPWSAIALNAGSFVFLIWALLIKDKAMITVNAGMLVIYTTGLIIKLSQ